MNWFKQHADSIVFLATLIGGLMWMNGKLNKIEQDILVIKTVMVMKNIMPPELSSNKPKPDQEIPTYSRNQQ